VIDLFAGGLLLALALAVTGQGASPASPSSPPDCTWYKDWETLRPKVDDLPHSLRPPRRRKGSAERIHPNPGEHYDIEGPWIVVAVISAAGRVLDARVVRHAATPPWPRYEAALLKSVRKWEYQPATLNGHPVAFCMAIRLQDR
jgi:hypothetical protein